MTEACRIIITQEKSGVFSVSAPMSYKELCYDILADAKTVIDYERNPVFFSPGRTLIVTMNMDGRVDVAAPAPSKEWCYMALSAARRVIEEYDGPEQKQRPAGYADPLPLV
jgi:hypothetical protein